RVDLYDWLVHLHAAWQRSGAPPCPLPPLSVDTVELLLLQRWPLNLRSLERLVRELTTRCLDRQVDPCDLPDWLDRAPRTGPTELPSSAPALAAASSPTIPPPSIFDPPITPPRPPLPSRDEFIAAFEQLGGSVRALARHFGRERRQIYRWIEAHG